MLKNSRHKTVAWGFFIAIVAGYLLMATRFPLAYIVATYEDLVGEWAQVFLFATTMLLAVKIACTKSNYRAFYGVLALACLFVVGEEISWGQRIFNIATPEFFEAHNLQNETNLHNFFTGPIKTDAKKLLEYLIALGLIGYGLLFPLLIRVRWQFAGWLTKRGVPHPPLYLWPFFVLSAFLELGIISFNEAELAEVLIPLALAIMAMNHLQGLRKQTGLTDVNNWNATESSRLARQTVYLVLGTTLLALVTTAASYSSPRLQAVTDARILNGVEKFADRYKRFNQWQTAAQLYAMVHAEEPGRADILRELFICHKELKEPQVARTFLEKSIQLETAALAKTPLSVASHLSLANSYRLMDKPADAQDHLQASLEIGQLNARKNPQNAAAAYWLGRAYEAKGVFPKALLEYQRAQQLAPGILRYQKAVLYLTRQLAEQN